MPIKTFRPITPTLRFQTTLVNDDITTDKPHKPLLVSKQRTGGRRNSGDMTMRHHGGGHKKKLRLIDFKREKFGVPGKVATIEYDPEPLLAHRADPLCGWREALHPAAGRPEGWPDGDERSGGGHPDRQRAAAQEHSGRHHGAQRRAAAGQGRADGALGGRAGTAGGEGRRLCAA